MTTKYHYMYMGGGPDDIPIQATHVTVHPSVTVIVARAFTEHPNIVELICHVNVKIIEKEAFYCCLSLKRVIIPGVVILKKFVFTGCEALLYVECDKLERIKDCAFAGCYSLRGINLPSAKVIGFSDVFKDCKALKYVTFGKYLTRIASRAFNNCESLERITIPLTNKLYFEHDAFMLCPKLKRADLIDSDKYEIHETTDALLLEEWRRSMNLCSLYTPLPYENGTIYQVGKKAHRVKRWIRYILQDINYFKDEHCRLLNEVSAVLQLVLPDDIVIRNVLPFLELPNYTFDEEECEYESDSDSFSDSDSDSNSDSS